LISLTLAEIAAATDGELLDADPGSVATGIAVDSREIGPGTLFAALPGERTDGTRFIATATASGAVASLMPAGHPDRDAWERDALPRIQVTDVQTALGAVGRAVRLRSTARVVGVTGSSGKTSTKDMLLAVLAPHRRTIANERSFNNEVGLPLTLGRIEPDTEVVVVEMGTAGSGQIAELCDIASPDVAVVTIVGMAHYEQFGSQEAIATEKSALPAAVGADGLAVLNADDPRVLAMRERTAARVITYGVHADADVRARDVRLDGQGQPRFSLLTPDGTAEVELPAIGEHMVVNALAAAATAHGLGLRVDEIAAGLAAFRLSPGRMQTTTREDGVTVIDDTYNANPVSVEAALRALAAARTNGGRIVAVLGAMADLAQLAIPAHEDAGRLAATLGVDLLVGVGEHPGHAVLAAQEAGLTGTLTVERPDQVAEALEGLLRPGDVVLLKGSRVVGLDTAAKALITARTPDAEPVASGRGPA
jgi:UDP-N-acetylmuramoyl-tripeptide--D-alanyl-D-alanine ligase